MADAVQNIASVEEFQQTIASGVVLVDFYATWCGPCRMQLPILSELAAELGDAVSIVKVNVDELPQLASQYGVSSIPHLTLLNDGQVVDNMVGLQKGPDLKAAINGATV